MYLPKRILRKTVPNKPLLFIAKLAVIIHKKKTVVMSEKVEKKTKLRSLQILTDDGTTTLEVLLVKLLYKIYVYNKGNLFAF